MQKRFSNMSAIALIAAGLGACSSAPPAAAPPGPLAPGTAQVTINDRALPETRAVKCIPIGSLTTVTTGDAAAGTKAFVSNEGSLTAKSVNIRDLGGFTGSYAEGLQGTADVTLRGYTYTIRGRAEGFDTGNPSFGAISTFTIKVSC